MENTDNDDDHDDDVEIAHNTDDDHDDDDDDDGKLMIDESMVIEMENEAGGVVKAEIKEENESIDSDAETIVYSFNPPTGVPVKKDKDESDDETIFNSRDDYEENRAAEIAEGEFFGSDLGGGSTLVSELKVEEMDLGELNLGEVETSSIDHRPTAVDDWREVLEEGEYVSEVKSMQSPVGVPEEGEEGGEEQNISSIEAEDGMVMEVEEEGGDMCGSEVDNEPLQLYGEVGGSDDEEWGISCKGIIPM
ncbi:acidic leucine-rich nuclear phosphoprotein 32-related protein 1-like [Diachasma alloeum]|uniref:acidic leucine-rich nuclear phosphoprotein 32-related protein 1-like n=1 Tax=Diachasma alloeum TaxID=454923 RepID=UPI0007382A22|nr:acidic leucine-rich nuclear phosphoprotein 32-related protein 1-like [Diachasma alloeum]